MDTSKAIRLFGSGRGLAAALKVTPQAVSKWKKAGRLPPRRILELEKIVCNVPAVDPAVDPAAGP